jgi:5-(carboxyamino)imidazole ribonucleotide mutase
MTSKKIDVQVIVGSKSDEAKMRPTLEILEEFGIAFDFKVASAHRTPEYVEEIIDSAINQGVKVFITAAGMANHLSGAVASRTTLPVIGIPLSGGVSGGMDSLLSTVQMPPGVPVATVAIDGSKNGAILAIEILSIENKELQKKLIEYRHKETEKIRNAV